MNRIAVITNRQKDPELVYTNKIISLLEQNCEVCLAADSEYIKNALSGADAAIVLGGDGTILSCAAPASELGVPVLGINLGTLGFLAEVEKTEAEYALSCLKDGKYRIDERLMLTASVVRNGEVIYSNSALNDFVVSRSSFRRIISTDVYVDNSFVGSYEGDGLILATPTGSTGYSLSAGGPIIDTGLNAAVITPICPHTSFSTSIIVPGDKSVKIYLNGVFARESMLTTDGQSGFCLESDDIIEIRASSKKAKLIKVHDRSLYEVLSIKNITKK